MTDALQRAREILARPMPATWRHRVADVTRERATELCREAWSAPYDETATDAVPLIDGACAAKAHWLQQRLGGAVFSADMPGGSYHAALLFVCDGQLLVADAGQITPIAEYACHFVGFYEKS